ncbi:DUF3160 domain-containing protein [Opitutus terrae]|uniref:DUF3160 domain-containing protein n=1 Tax=Opitutus terrae (strain DSM 11246 / JCM 15787 / PB90-1) TaxID=452637 RepID=B1ZNS1_OPITP|nr:DUF3160 domain-containing protein [Opitutus terrae]ACB75441.1 hypothetical protein Oter_2158 [Opitutus terrae PB90-1]
MRPRLRLLLVLLLVSLTVHAQESAPSAEPPPPPEPPRPRDFATPEAAAAAWQKWRADERAWRRSLTLEQKTVLQQRAEEKQQRTNEPMERAQRLPRAEDGYSWREAAKSYQLSPAALAQLEQQKFTYGKTVKQSFDPYLGGPVFITSDSLLNGFHVLLEDSFRAHELRQADVLRTTLATILQRIRASLGALPQPARETRQAWEQVQRVLGPALCLLGEPIENFDRNSRPEINRQLKLINAAKQQQLPPWLAPATLALREIDYRRCRPVGFYSSDPKLADYFRAVRWLQMIPFRADRDVELEAILLLGSHTEYEEAQSGLGSARFLLGSAAGLGLREAQQDFQALKPPANATARSTLLAQKRYWVLRHAMSNDEWTQWSWDDYPAELNQRLGRIQYVVLPAAWLPDTDLFQRIANAGADPQGLAVAAWMGSDFARRRCDPELLAIITETQAAQHAANDTPTRHAQRSLYDDYLEVLRSLFQAPPPEAPAFVQSTAWQAKSAQTALAGWAQIRHTFTLQAHESQTFLGLFLAPAGFVEPNPEFFARMGDLAERGRASFNQNRERWDLLITLTRRLEALVHKQLRGQPWSKSEDTFLRDYGASLAALMGYEGNSYLAPRDDAPRSSEVHRDLPGDKGLAVAIGRPRLIHVLYPWNGLEILCSGSVMPYYEYWTKERLTDAEWITLLDSPERPQQPAWIAETLPEASRPE